MTDKSTSKLLLRAKLFLFILALPLSANAEWSGGIEGGTVLQGDQKGTTIEFLLYNNDRPFSQELTAEWLNLEDGDNIYEVAYEPKYWFLDFAYAFGEGSVKTFGSTSFDNYDRTIGAGVGMEFVSSATQQLYAEIGALQATSVLAATPGVLEINDSVLFSAFTIGGQQILSDLVKIEFDADYLTSEDLDAGLAEVGLSLRISNGAIKYSYRYRSTTIADEEKQSLTDSSISVKYNF